MPMGRSKLRLLILLSICLLLSCTEAIIVKYCGGEGNYDIKVQSVVISPYPVKAGTTATFTISASTDKTICGGRVTIDVSYLTLVVHSETYDLCLELSCPVKPGAIALSHTKTLPGLAPRGSYILKMRIVDKNDHQLTCFAFNFKIG